MGSPSPTGSVLPSASEQTLNALTDAVLAADDTGRIVLANSAAEALLGWSAIELTGMQLTAILPPPCGGAHVTDLRRMASVARADGTGGPLRVAARHRGGSEIDLEVMVSELRSPAGGAFAVAVLRDVRDRVALELKVAAQRKILAQYATVAVLAEASDASIAMPRLLAAMATALEWEVGIYWSPAPASGRLAVSATWSSGSEGARAFVEGSRSMTFASDEGLPGIVLASRRAEWSRDPRADSRYGRSDLVRDSGLRSALAFPIYSHARTWGVLEYLSRNEESLDEELRQTITALGFQIGQFLARLESEESLRRASASAEAERKKLQALFESVPAAIAIVRGPEMRCELSNTVNQRLAGERQLVGRTIQEAWPELEADGMMAMIRRVYETGEPVLAREYPVTALPAADGKARRVFMNGACQPFRGRDGRIEGVMLFAYEVTDLVASRQRVAEAEERLRLAIEAAEIGTCDYDPLTGAVRCDARFRQLFGVGTEAPISATQLLAAIHPDDKARVNEAAQRSFDPAAGGEYAAEYRAIGIEDGVERWVAVRGRTLFDEEGKPSRFVGTCIDVTGQKTALDRVRFLAEASSILASSLDYRTTLALIAKLAIPRLADWCTVELDTEGHEPEQVVVEHVDPAKIELARKLRRRYSLAPGHRSDVERVLRTGQALLVSDVTDEMLIRGTHDAEHLQVLRQLRVRSAMLLPLKARERVIGVLALFYAESGRRFTSQDLTFGDELARRAATAIDNARLYEQAQHAVGVRDQFLSIASHELRTPLTSLTLNLSSFSRLVAGGAFAGIPAGEKLSARVALMEQQVVRMTALVNELLDVSRIATGRLVLERKSIDIVQLVREVLDRLREDAEAAGCTLALEAPDAAFGTFDKHRLDQVVANLVANAVKYAGGKPIQVRVHRVSPTIRIAVSDQGPGITPADQDRIFEQFERAAPVTLAGLGLGLWIARSIVDAHGGRIQVESALGRGATFTIDLPERPSA